jgi:hypothetical protein
MSKVKGGNIFTQLIAEFCEVSQDKALEIQDYIDSWLELDWSEATNLEIEATALMAQRLIKEKNN